MKPQFSCITVIARGGRLAVLQTGCEASAAFDPATLPAHQHPTREKFMAIWDTGATASVITQEVVDRCGLKPTGMTQVHGVQGVSVAETFLVNITLMDGRIQITNVRVTRGTLPPGAQVLIGMDIITTGDFAITNVGGNTVFSFRIPSIKTINYNEEAEAQNARLQLAAERKQRKLTNKHRKRFHH